jgi:glycosyltransferase involved in cell wall biosynthesis
MKICMLSNVHPADDIRIFEKEARSLARAGHSVTVVANPPLPLVPDQIEFKLIEGVPVSRWLRPWVFGRQAMALALSSKAEAIQFHDPELIPYAFLLKKKMGCKVIYDVHEDVPADIYSKKWIPRWVQPLISQGASTVEGFTARHFDAIVAATPMIADRFRGYGGNVTLVRNSVQLDEFIHPDPRILRKNQAVYVGHVSFNRGLAEMVEACEAVKVPLMLAGSIGPAESEWLRNCAADVTYLGKMGRKQIAELLNESLIGLCLLHADPNHLHAMPTKIFEYMAAGLAVITSDLPKSKEIVESAGCGFAVSLSDKKGLIEKLWLLRQDREHAMALGLAGRATVGRDYNWEHDAAALRALYTSMSRSSVVT